MSSDMLSQAQMQAALEGLKTTYTGNVKVGLFTNTPRIDSKDTKLSDFTEPTGSWYTQKALTLYNLRENAQEGLELQGASVRFDYSGSDPQEIVKGYFVVYQPTGGPPAPAPQLVCARMLDNPVSMGHPLDGLTVEPSVTVPAVQAS